LKKLAGSVRFRFYKQKTEPNRKNRAKTGKNRAKTEKSSQTGTTEPNRFEPVFALKNRTEPNQNRSV